MNKKNIAVLAALLTLTAGSAWADTATGRITYLSSDGHQLMLDNHTMYALGPDAATPALLVGQRVTLTYQDRGGQNVVSDAAKAS